MSATKEWTAPMVAALAVVTAGIVIMFGLTTDLPTKQRLITLFEALVGLIVGVSAGAAVGYTRGYRAAVQEASGRPPGKTP